MTRLRDSEQGLAGISLVLIIGWALAAVLMLTGTLIAAEKIDSSVASITTEVTGIDEDLDSVQLVIETNRIASGILVAAQPLSEHLDSVISSAGSINETATGILNTAGEINTTVKAINGTAKSIGATVGSINGNIGSILTLARSIEQGVADINTRADIVIGLVQGIKSDTGNILTQVGAPGTGHPNSIHGHANSIDCAGLVSTLGLVGSPGSSFCNE